MENVIGSVLATQVIIIVLLIIIIFYLIRQSHVLKLEKRFEAFSLRATVDKERSFFDIFVSFIWQLVHKLGNILNKSVVLKKYGTKYEKYITFEEKEFKSGIDYIALKLMIGFILVILNIITVMFQYIKVSPISYLITFLIGFYSIDIFLNLEFRKKRKRIEEDLLKAIIIMNNSFKSGRNIMQAIETVKTELDGPIADEFKKIYLDITYGLSLDVVFNRFYERVKLDDAKYIASSLTLLNKTGGNIVRVFSTIEKSFYNKRKLKNELNSLTSASIFVFRILVCLPFIFALVIYVLNPSYFSPLFTTHLGWFFLSLIIIIFILYIIVIKKVLEVKI